MKTTTSVFKKRKNVPSHGGITQLDKYEMELHFEATNRFRTSVAMTHIEAASKTELGQAQRSSATRHVVALYFRQNKCKH
jgi:hypothetical protein